MEVRKASTHLLRKEKLREEELNCDYKALDKELISFVFFVE